MKYNLVQSWTLRFPTLLGGLLVGLSSVLSACGSTGPVRELGETKSAISQGDSTVLTFEATQAWTSDIGSPIAQAPGASGNGVALNGQGYRRIVSKKLNTLGTVRDYATLKVKVDQYNQYWPVTVQPITTARRAQLRVDGRDEAKGHGSFEWFGFSGVLA